MILEYKCHKVFGGITLVYKGDTLLGDYSGVFFHPTFEFERLTKEEQTQVYEVMAKDGIM